MQPVSFRRVRHEGCPVERIKEDEGQVCQPPCREKTAISPAVSNAQSLIQ
ncbi:MAG TPA: hypothetical protein VEI57_18915 [Nitrospirota bacterium]|nr:hypothetical protein [Nitrospirota bacterium]